MTYTVFSNADLSESLSTGGDGLEVLTDVFTIVDLTGSNLRCHLGEEDIVTAFDVIADGKVLDLNFIGLGSMPFGRSRCSQVLVAVMTD